MANNYTPNYNQYLTQTAGYALPSNVRSYSVFDPSSNSWRRMTNNGMSPMQQGTQADIQAALRYADSSRGRVWDNPAPVQVPVQTPLGSSRRVSQPLSRGGTVVLQSQPANDPVAEAMSLRGSSTDASAVSLSPNLNYAFRSGYENFQREIPRSNMYGPLQNPRIVRNMSPDYQEATSALVPNMSPDHQTPNSIPAQAADNNGSFWDTPLGNLIYHHPANMQRLLLQKGYRTAKPYIAKSNAALEEFDRQAKKRIREFGSQAKKNILDWDAGFINWLNN